MSVKPLCTLTIRKKIPRKPIIYGEIKQWCLTYTVVPDNNFYKLKTTRNDKFYGLASWDNFLKDYDVALKGNNLFEDNTPSGYVGWEVVIFDKLPEDDLNKIRLKNFAEKI
jgi:hypothetical protein